MSEGKHKPRAGNPGWSLMQIYVQDKGYVKWVRSHINQGSGRMMRRLKLYIEMRDRVKAARMDMEENGGVPPTAYPTQAVIPPNLSMSMPPAEVVCPGPAAPQIPAMLTPEHDTAARRLEMSGVGSPFQHSQVMYHTPPCSTWSRASTPMATPKMSCKRSEREDDMEIQEMTFEVASKWRRMTVDAILNQDAEEKKRTYVFNVARLMEKENGITNAVDMMARLMSLEIPELMATGATSSGPMP